jgi:hypothetical protein
VFRLFAADTGAALYSVRSAAQYRTLQTSVVDAVGDMLTRLGYSAPGDPAVENAGVRFAAASVDSATPGSRFDSRAMSDASAASAGSGPHRGRARTRSVLNERHVEASAEAQATNALLLGNGLVCAGALVENSKLSGEWAVHEGAAVLGVRGLRARSLVVPPGVLVQELAQRGGGLALIAYKLSDEPDLAWAHGGTFMGVAWPVLLKRMGLHAEDLWPAPGTEPPVPPHQQRQHRHQHQHQHRQETALALAAAPSARTLPEAARCLRNARLFPIIAKDDVELNLAQFYLVGVLAQLAAAANSADANATTNSFNAAPLKHIPPAAMYLSRAAYLRATRVSLSEAEERADPVAEAAWRAQLALRIDEFRIAIVLLEGAPAEEAARAYEPILRRMAALGHTKILDLLDDIACGLTTRPDVAWGALGCTSHALDAFADAADAKAARDARDAGPKATLPEAASAVAALRHAAQGAKPQPHAVRRLAEVRRALLGQLAPYATAAHAPEPLAPHSAEALVLLAAHYRAVLDGRKPT